MGIGVARPRQKEEPRYAIYGSVLAELEVQQAELWYY